VRAVRRRQPREIRCFVAAVGRDGSAAARLAIGRRLGQERGPQLIELGDRDLVAPHRDHLLGEQRRAIGDQVLDGSTKRGVGGGNLLDDFTRRVAGAGLEPGAALRQELGEVCQRWLVATRAPEPTNVDRHRDQGATRDPRMAHM
jgi:hypothetical protein